MRAKAALAEQNDQFGLPQRVAVRASIKGTAGVYAKAFLAALMARAIVGSGSG